MSLSPKEIQDLKDELKASRTSRRRAWEVLQEIRWVLQDSAGVVLPPPAKKTIDSEGRTVKDGLRDVLRKRQDALEELLKAIGDFRKLSDQPLALRGSEYAQAVHDLNRAIEWADRLLSSE